MKTIPETWKAPNGIVYDVSYCDKCDNMPIIQCPACNESSCYGDGCEVCGDAFEKFLDLVYQLGIW